MVHPMMMMACNSITICVMFPGAVQMQSFMAFLSPATFDWQLHAAHVALQYGAAQAHVGESSKAQDRDLYTPRLHTITLRILSGPFLANEQPRATMLTVTLTRKHLVLVLDQP